MVLKVDGMNWDRIGYLWAEVGREHLRVQKIYCYDCSHRDLLMENLVRKCLVQRPQRREGDQSLSSGYHCSGICPRLIKKPMMAKK